MTAKHKSSLLKRDNLKRSCGHSSGLWRFDNQHFWEWCWLGEHKEQPRRITASRGEHLMETTMLCPSEWTASTPVIQRPSEIPRFFMRWEKHTAALRLFVLADWGQCQCTNTSFPKANSFPWGGEAPSGGHPTLERKPCSEIRLPLPSAGFWQEQHWGYRWWHWGFMVLEEDEWTGWVTSLTWFWLVMCYCMKDFLGQDR